MARWTSSAGRTTRWSVPTSMMGHRLDERRRGEVRTRPHDLLHVLLGPKPTAPVVALDQPLDGVTACGAINSLIRATSRGSVFGVVSRRSNSATARSASCAPLARCSTSARRPRASVISSRAASRACRSATKHSAAEACRGAPLVASPHRSQRDGADTVVGGGVRSAPRGRAPRLRGGVTPLRRCWRPLDARGFFAMAAVSETFGSRRQGRNRARRAQGAHAPSKAITPAGSTKRPTRLPPSRREGQGVASDRLAHGPRAPTT